MKTETGALWLGTALWGWGVDEQTAFALLDLFVDRGGSVIDAAVNYPINNRPEDFGRSNHILAKWLRSNPGVDAKVFCKVGALDNSGGSQVILRHSSILTSTEMLRGIFLENLWGVGVHWDNREDVSEIVETLEAMEALDRQGLDIGFSGVRRPDLYAKVAPHLSNHWWIEVKENAATCEPRQRYAAFFPKARYMAYGINMGGVKQQKRNEADSSLALRRLSEPPVADRLRAFINSDHQIRPRPASLNELALLMAFVKPELSGVIVGSRSLEQLSETISFWAKLSCTPIDDPARATLAKLATG